MKPNFPKWVDDLFLKLSFFYEGHFLDANFDKLVDSIKKTAWLSELQRFKPETILEASNRVIRKHPSYPPTLGEFCAICEEVFQVKRIPEYTRLAAPEAKKQENVVDEEKLAFCRREKERFQEMVSRIRAGKSFHDVK